MKTKAKPFRFYVLTQSPLKSRGCLVGALIDAAWQYGRQKKLFDTQEQMQALLHETSTLFLIRCLNFSTKKDIPNCSINRLDDAARKVLKYAHWVPDEIKNLFQEWLFDDEKSDDMRQTELFKQDDSDELSKQIRSVRHAVAEQACRIDDIDRARQELSIECRRTRDAFQDWKKIHDIKDGERENQIDSIDNDLAVLMRILHEAFPMLSLPTTVEEMKHELLRK